MRARLGAAALLLLLVAGFVADETNTSFHQWAKSHQFAASLLANALLVAVTAAIVERALQSREDRKWAQVAEPYIKRLRSTIGTLVDVSKPFAAESRRLTTDDEWKALFGDQVAVRERLVALEREIDA